MGGSKPLEAQHASYKGDSPIWRIALFCSHRIVELCNCVGDNAHIAFRVDDYETYHAPHEETDCIVRENPRMGLYFITDPNGQWIEIPPE